MSQMKYFAIEGHAKSDFEAISLCAQKLKKEGYVTDQFESNCINREKQYPTGLPTVVPVAMPHSEASGVIDNAICMLKLDQPVDFRRMDDETQLINAKMVFNLALKDTSHMSVLQHLMGLFADTNKMEDIYNTDVEDLPRKLEAYINQGEQAD
ncbi:PTS sugar transporter subunit IIA [Catenisphaera adipataccumulans]|jgi:PTS system galactitol-specific IIA component|uniref:PTS system galactitol-specific IIA component n=1 Tax=Catenisphaera adipataccumulans TaxID=700500 RepID=A0A7W8FVN2_9FIRM|nr:PTS sugar transporter subunit IIA [Catenisphaera adipataccumulans]MBB5183323.1 PTS system galactitol-specific IIA component [Catenisphaera adipataccumulans]